MNQRHLSVAVLPVAGVAILGVAAAVLTLAGPSKSADPPPGWSALAPRDEIRPRFAYDPKGGRNGTGAFIIEAGERQGTVGYWSKTLPVTGGKHYRFRAFRRVKNVPVPRSAIRALLGWRDSKGQRVRSQESIVSYDKRASSAWAWQEHPGDGLTDARGWTEVSGVYRAPLDATQAVVDLYLLWTPGGRVEWSDISLEETGAPQPRKVRLATAHLNPKAKTPAEACRLFAPLIRDAASRKADLVVLPETLTSFATGLEAAEAAEPVPGPSTDYFGSLARQHNLYIVAGLYERADHLVYNVAVLIGPDGKVAGKYRKVTLPTGEGEKGVAPGNDYPVFDTRFGRIGMMICYDGFYPEVARELANRGAEVIAWPVMGCNPRLAAARAIENHVYVVSSTYTDISGNWIVSGIFDHAGETLAVAKDYGTVALAEVDLESRTRWLYLGDFRAKIARHRPVTSCER